MATDLPAIRQRIVVDDGALGGLQSRFGRVAGTLGKAVAAGAAVATAAVGAFVVQGVRGATDVDRGLREVNSLFGLTGDEGERNFRKLRSGVAELSDEMGIAQDVLTDGLYSAISAGVPQDNVFEFMEVASKAAIGGVTDVETAVDGLSTIINAWGLEASDAEAVADSMFAAVQGGKTTFEELSASMFQVAPSAAAAGIGFDEVNAGIATLTAGGMPTAQAANRMRAAIDELADPSREVSELFEELSGKSFRDFIAEGGNVQEALGLIQDHAEESGDAIGDYFGSVQAGQAATVLATTGAEKFGEELDRQADAAGGAGQAFEEMEKSTARQMERLKVNFQNAAIAVGHELLPAINRIVTWATDALPGAIDTARSFITGLIETFQAVRETVTTVVAWVSERWESLRPILQGIAIAVGIAFGPHFIATMVTAAVTTVAQVARMVASWVMLQARTIAAAAVHSAQLAMMAARSIASAGRVVMALGTIIATYARLAVQSMIHAARIAASWLIAMGPIGWVIAAVVALVALIIANWDRIRDFTVRAWEAIVGFVVDAWDAIVEWVKDAGRAIIAFVKDNWQTILAVITGPVGMIVALIISNWDRIVAFVRSAGERIMAAVRSAWDRVTSSVRNAGERIVSTIRSAWDRARSTVISLATAIVSWVAGLPGRLVSALSSMASSLTSTARTALNSFRQGVVDGAMRAVEWLRGLPQRLLSALGNVGNMLKGAGRAILRGLADGIKSAARAPVDAVKNVAGRIRNLLPGSPVRDGPLRTLNRGRAGRAIGEMVASGLDDSRRDVARAAERVAGAAQARLDTPRDLELRRATDTLAASARQREGQAGGPDGGVSQTFHVEAFDVREAAAELGAAMAYSGKLLAAPKG